MSTTAAPAAPRSRARRVTLIVLISLAVLVIGWPIICVLAVAGVFIAPAAAGVLLLIAAIRPTRGPAGTRRPARSNARRRPTRKPR